MERKEGRRKIKGTGGMREKDEGREEMREGWQ